VGVGRIGEGDGSGGVLVGVEDFLGVRVNVGGGAILVVQEVGVVFGRWVETGFGCILLRVFSVGLFLVLL